MGGKNAPLGVNAFCLNGIIRMSQKQSFWRQNALPHCSLPPELLFL